MKQQTSRFRLITTVLTWLLIVLGLVNACVLCFAAPTNQASPVPTQSPVSATQPPIDGPYAGLTVLVDAGHGGYDGGARCRDSGVWEKQMNLAVAKKLETILTAGGAKVIMTRTADEDLCTAERPASVTKKREDMEKRVAMAVDGNANMVLSVHMNEYRTRLESGPQVFYRAGCEGGRLLAGCIQEAMIRCLEPRKERTSMAGDYFILQLDVPSVLVECGFISNPAEEKLLLDEAYQQKTAQAIAKGVEEFWKLQRQDAMQ